MAEREVIGGYRIEKKLGVGGMSTVYQVVDDGGDRYALKLLHPSISADPNARDRLRREVRTLRQVIGPYVAQVVDAETEDVDAFIVTELIEGPTLSADVQHNGAYVGKDLADLAKELADALDAIHAKGVLHRDLKPSNVMMSDRGPVLIDFGIAQVAEESRLTATGLIAHTPGYCAPEVLNGEDPTTEADWWAWAAVLAFAATGQAPFGTGHSPKVTRKVLTGEAFLEDIDPVVAYALQAALVPQVERRPSPREIIGMLDGSIEVSEAELAAGHEATWRQERPTDSQVAAAHTIVPDSFPPPQTHQAPSYPPVYDQGGSAVFHPRQDSNVVAQARFDPTYGGHPASAGIPPWLQPPRKKPLVTIMAWLAFVAWAGVFPTIATVAFTAFHLVMSTVGVSGEALNRTRIARGGRFRGEGMWVIARGPLSFFTGLVHTCASVGSGVVVGGGLAWILSHNTDYNMALIVALGAVVGSALAWVYPTSRACRTATRSTLHQIAPTAGYSLFWVVLSLAIGSLAVAMYSGADVPDWSPIGVPSIFN